MKRLIRRWLESTNTPAAAAPSAAAPAIGTSGVPPTKATANTIEASTIAEPRSPCNRHNPAASAATSIVGFNVRVRSCISASRLVSRSAQYSRTASFMNSLGCRLSEPSDTHELAPFTSRPTPGRNGTSIKNVAMPRPGTTKRRNAWYGTRAQIHSATVPRIAHTT